MSNLVGGPGIIVSSCNDSCYQTGIMRWNSSQQKPEVMSGDTWVQLNSGIGTVMLDPQYQLAIEWAIRKQREELELAKLCSLHPGLQEVKEKYELMLALVRQELQNGTV